MLRGVEDGPRVGTVVRICLGRIRRDQAFGPVRLHAMKILLFTPTFLPSLGGAERMADTLVRQLIERGHDVQVRCQWCRGQRRSEEQTVER